MIDALIVYKLLTPWQLGRELDDAVFHTAATFPLRELKHKSCMMPGDEYFGFDPNAFIQQLVDETGISHVWEPVATRVPEGGRLYIRLADIGETSQESAIAMFWQAWLYQKNLTDQDFSACQESILSFAAFLADHFNEYLEAKQKIEEGRRRFEQERQPKR